MVVKVTSVFIAAGSHSCRDSYYLVTIFEYLSGDNLFVRPLGNSVLPVIKVIV